MASTYRLFSFVGGTAVLQGLALAVAFFLRSQAPLSLPQPEGKTVPEVQIGQEAPLEQLATEEEAILHVVKRGDTLSSIWTQHGAPRIGGVLAARALKAVGISESALKEGETLELLLSKTNDIVRFKKRLNDGKGVTLTGDSKTGYTAKIETFATTEVERTVSGIITDSFSLAAADLSVPYSVVDDLVDLFSGRVEFQRTIQPGDSFMVSYVERHLPSGEFFEAGPISVASIKTNSHVLVAIRHRGGDGQYRYFDEQGDLLGTYFLRYPLKFSSITSSFSAARFHPILHKNRPHNGVDFAAPIGTAVRSVADGVVKFAGWGGQGGTTVRIEHCDRYSTAYLHLSRLAPGLRKGSHVSRGEVIGAVGMSGLATGPHLHFSLFDRGRFINPLGAELPRLTTTETLPKAILVAALETVSTYHSLVRVALPTSAKAA